MGILNLLKTVTPEKSDFFFLSLLGILTYFGILIYDSFRFVFSPIIVNLDAF